MTTKTPTKSAVKQLVMDRVHCDKVVTKKDGTFAVRRGYFYRHGMTAEKLASEYTTALPEFEVVNFSDHWNAWPKDSFFEVVVRVRGSN